jgi:hypothetical protein
MSRRFPPLLLLCCWALGSVAPLLAEPTASHRAAAAELLQVMEIRQQAEVAVEKVLDLQLAQNPAVRAQREVILEWMRSVVASQEAMDRLAELYAERFSEAELRELTAFYATPIGKRAVRELPALMEQGMLIGQQLAQQHSGELRRRLEEHAATQREEGGAAVAATASGERDGDAARATVAALRNVGTAMMAWTTDAVDTLPMASEKTAGDPRRIDWSRCTRISYDDLRLLLVDEYIAEIPRQDGWGHDLEFCLERQAIREAYYAGVRSPGRDGSFEGDEYSNGPFPHAEPDRDVVWMDGFFVTWPE